MDGPAVFVQSEVFNHTSLVTLLKPQVLFCTPHLQTLQPRQAYGAAYFLLAGFSFGELCHIRETHSERLRAGLSALGLAGVHMCEIKPRPSIFQVTYHFQTLTQLLGRLKAECGLQIWDLLTFLVHHCQNCP